MTYSLENERINTNLRSMTTDGEYNALLMRAHATNDPWLARALEHWNTQSEFEDLADELTDELNESKEACDRAEDHIAELTAELESFKDENTILTEQVNALEDENYAQGVELEQWRSGKLPERY